MRLHSIFYIFALLYQAISTCITINSFLHLIWLFFMEVSVVNNYKLTKLD
jgi:hypothetical protein